MTPGYGWERARLAVSLLGVENPERPGTVSQSEDDLTLCFQIFSRFVKG